MRWRNTPTPKANKKQKPVKLGLAPVQREGMEYEFTVFMDVDQNHNATTSKDRTDLFKDRIFLIDEKVGEELLVWLNTGVDREELAKKKRIVQLLKMLGHEITAENAAETVKTLTKEELVPAHYAEIVSKLEVLVSERAEAAKSSPAGVDAPAMEEEKKAA